MIPSQTIPIDDEEEVLAGAALTNNSPSMNLGQNSFRMKCYYHHKQNYFLDYFDDHFPDDAVIYKSDIPFQYSEREGRYTLFIGNPTGTIFVATKRDHKIL